ncbi:hypothetical protein [Paenibacillus sp. y28]|uniref:hypothetical protein n=1 Tax=Paenibacillus sp. y28 TaxID=3129110 RepID=UPI00301A59A3
MNFSKPFKWMVVLGVAIALFGLISITSSADNKTVPGSADDPIVTKSYLEEVLKQINPNLVIQQPTATPTPQPTPSSSPSSGTGQSGSSNQNTIEVVQLKANQILYAGSGTEFIVRTGKTILVSSDENGVPDVTVGKDIAPNGVIENNHLLIFPREGRGIKPDPKSTSEIYVMVKGSYLLADNK